MLGYRYGQRQRETKAFGSLLFEKTKKQGYKTHMYILGCRSHLCSSRHLSGLQLDAAVCEGLRIADLCGKLVQPERGRWNGKQPSCKHISVSVRTAEPLEGEDTKFQRTAPRHVFMKDMVPLLLHDRSRSLSRGWRGRKGRRCLWEDLMVSARLHCVAVSGCLWVAGPADFVKSRKGWCFVEGSCARSCR